MSRHMLLQKEAQREQIKLDYLSWGNIIFALFSTLLISVTSVATFEQDLAVKALIVLGFMLSGLVLHLGWFSRINTDTIVDGFELVDIITSIVFGFMGVIIAQITAINLYGTSILSLTYKSLSTISPEIAGILMLNNIAVAEETFFRFAVQPMMEDLFKITVPKWLSQINSVVITSVLFTSWHVVYSGQPDILLGVFFSSVVLCLVSIKSKRLIVPQLIHQLVNLI